MRIVLVGARVPDIQVSRLIPSPLELEAWRADFIAPGTIRHRTVDQTDSGWPLLVYDVARLDGGRAVFAAYTFFEYSAWATIEEELSNELLMTLRSAEPHWAVDGLVTCVAELFA